MWRHNKGRVHRSKEYLQWIEDASWLIAATRPKMITGDCSLTITARPKDGRLRDAGNYEKPIGDLLEACRVVGNDRQFIELHIYRLPPSGGIHDVIVEVKEL